MANRRGRLTKRNRAKQRRRASAAAAARVNGAVVLVVPQPVGRPRDRDDDRAA